MSLLYMVFIALMKANNNMLLKKIVELFGTFAPMALLPQKQLLQLEIQQCMQALL